MEREARKRDNELLKRIFRAYLWPQKRRLASITLLILLGVLLGNLSPYLYGKMVDAINGGELRRLAELVGLYCAVTLVTMGMSLAEKYLGETVSFKMANAVKQEMFEKILYANSRDIQQFASGEVISRLNGDSESVIDFFLNLITNIGQISVNLAVSLGFILGISLRLSSVAVFYLPASFLVSRLARKHYRNFAKQQRETEDRHYGFLAEIFSHRLGIKIFQMERKALEQYQGIVREKYRLTKKSVHLGNAVNTLTTIVQLISSMYIIYISALLIRQGKLTLGIMVSFNTYINVMFSSVSQLWSFQINWQTALVAAGRITELLDGETEEQRSGAILSAKGQWRIETKALSFYYPGEKRAVFQGLDFTIDKPGLYGIVGRNGCGKSTLAKILLGLYPPVGNLYLNGRQIQEYSLNSLRKNVFYIQRDDFFIKDTIYNNLLLANEEATQKEIEKACQQAGAHQFISEFPKGYFTQIGEGGATLSSGQKQKLSLARALLRNSPVMILDEITANLDGAAERQALEALKRIKTKKIILIISHKISTIAECDRIFVMNEGRLAAEGQHEQLLTSCDIYQELFQE